MSNIDIIDACKDKDCIVERNQAMDADNFSIYELTDEELETITAGGLLGKLIGGIAGGAVGANTNIRKGAKKYAKKGAGVGDFITDLI